MAIRRPWGVIHRDNVVMVMIVIMTLERGGWAIRFPERISQIPNESSTSANLKTAVFALGSFWRSEALFGCVDGVVRTTAGYAGGSKPNPEYRSLGDHAESVKVFTYLFIKFVKSLPFITKWY